MKIVIIFETFLFFNNGCCSLLPVKVKVAPADVDEKVHFDKTGDIVVPGGTPIAFKVWELKVKASDGSITPMTLPKGQGGFLGNLRIEYTDTVGKYIESYGLY